MSAPEVHGEPVVQVRAAGREVATLRVRGPRYRPFALRDEPHTIGVGEPGTTRWRVLEGVRPGDGELRVELPR